MQIRSQQFIFTYDYFSEQNDKFLISLAETLQIKHKINYYFDDLIRKKKVEKKIGLKRIDTEDASVKLM